MYSGGLLSSPIWWSQIADSHCLLWKAAACPLPACGSVYYAALSHALTKTVRWCTSTDPAGATWQQLPNSLWKKKIKQKNALQVHSSYAYTENARGPPSSDVILNVFLAFQYRRGAAVFRAKREIRALWERSLCVCVCDTKIVSQMRGFRKKNEIKKKTKSHKRNLNCVDIWYSRKKIQNKSSDAEKRWPAYIYIKCSMQIF